MTGQIALTEITPEKRVPRLYDEAIAPARLVAEHQHYRNVPGVLKHNSGALTVSGKDLSTIEAAVAPVAPAGTAEVHRPLGTERVTTDPLVGIDRLNGRQALRERSPCQQQRDCYDS